MDLIVPACALNRNFGTVIVRMKMDRRHCSCSQPDCTHETGCELCKRTRFSKYNSDCDSVVDRCRQYRSSTARSRYVNVCAAVCLLLLIGGLSPQSSAAPHRSRVMERSRRASENPLWANPCDYIDSNSSPSQKHSLEIAPMLVTQARNAFLSATTDSLKEMFTKSQSFKSFDALVEMYEQSDWLRNSGNWYRPEVLPLEKKLYQDVPDEYMNKLMKNIDEVLPAMHKGLKMIVAGFYAYSKEGLNENVEADEILKEKLIQIMHDVRAVLCFFSDVMRARNLPILPVPDSEVPVFRNSSSKGILLYLDTLKYLEYLGQVFEKLSETETA